MRAFTSTTKVSGKAKQFADMGASKSRPPILLHLKTKSGVDIAELGRISEQEVLLNTGARFKIVKVDKMRRPSGRVGLEVFLEEI